MKPLSVGNVVSAGLRIYRDNFKKYYKLAFIGALWSWLPIYGWAKFYAMQGSISRLAYGEITEKPETVKDANRYVKGRMWSFLGAALLVFLRLLLAYIGGAIILAIALFAVFFISNILPEQIALLVTTVLGIAGFVVFFSFLIRLLASFFVSELPLAIEDDTNATKAIRRSQELSKGYVVNLVLILITASVVSFPLWGIVFALQMVPQLIDPADLALPASVFTLLSYIINTITSALIIPFWQSIKAVVYCDLRVRREGMGIDLGK
ncbi:DUF975 domain-containing protein [Pleurocapsales cyanobacterium LEGE 10410]|nr:DUF975 domain-containing protein [Pleurocapsales cyanobacterium LEGE 10410]